MINEWVCKYGKTTGGNCGYISDKNFNPNTAQNNSATYPVIFTLTPP